MPNLLWKRSELIFGKDEFLQFWHLGDLRRQFSDFIARSVETFVKIKMNLLRAQMPKKKNFDVRSEGREQHEVFWELLELVVRQVDSSE